jgi:hypothetical protein
MKKEEASYCARNAYITKSSGLLSDLADMVNNGALPLISAVVDGILVVRRRSSGQLLAVLPEQVRSHAGSVQAGILPLQRRPAVLFLDTVLLEHAWLSGGPAYLGVGPNPAIAPGVVADSP